MKKIILSFAAASMIFASCTKEVVVSEITGNPNAIGFDISTGKTRASESLIGTLQSDGNGIGIFATKKSGASQVAYINNLAYKYSSGTGTWGWDADQMWPTTVAEYPMNFYAYHPKAGTTLTTALTQSYTIGATMSGQKDLLATNKLAVTTRPASSTVKLDFQHILSQIKFKVIGGAGMTVKVQSIALKNIGSIRVFNYSTMAWGTAPTTPISYSYRVATDSPGYFTITGNGTTAYDVTGTSGSLMLLPQNLSSRAWDKNTANIGSQTYIEVVYRMYETVSPFVDHVGFTNAASHPNYSAASHSSLNGTPLFVKVGFPLPTNWEQSKTYTYTIYLGTPTASGGILIDGNFIDNTGAATDLPVVYPNPNPPFEPILPGEPIVDLDQPITFTVEVTGWSNASGISIGN